MYAAWTRLYAEREDEAAAALAIMYVTAGRASDVLRVQTKNVHLKVKVKVKTPEGVDEVVVSAAAAASPNLCSLRLFRLHVFAHMFACFRAEDVDVCVG